MHNSLIKIYILVFGLFACKTPVPAHAQAAQDEIRLTSDENTLNGAERLTEYLPHLQNKKVAIIANHTSMVGNTHLVDTLLSLKIDVIKVFAPEHGFRGMADAGQKVQTSIDEKTGLPIISLYGKNKKPTMEQLSDVDVVIFDIQDVGARFYTYISTMTYAMEACAENNKELIILDRPNPNGHYVDGPVLNPELKSFVGMHPVPIVHGMTVGEYAMMVNGEKWLSNGVMCKLSIIKVDNYDHKTFYQVPIPPSPNLKTMQAIYLYPTTCLFEGTDLSVGRGTEDPFTMVGHPSFTSYTYNFTPKSMPGATNPKFMDQKCYGINFLTDSKWGTTKPLNKIMMVYLIEMYKQFPAKEKFFTNFFSQLVGNVNIKTFIVNGKSETEIRDTWKKEVEDFKKIRKKYLLYPDFE